MPEYEYQDNRERWWADCNEYIHRSKYYLRLSRKQDEIKKQYQEGKIEMDITKGESLPINEKDLHLSKGELKEKHREWTRQWLERMLSAQSERCANESSYCMSKLIAHWGISLT
ncbi:MAG: hypothetical protein KAT70_06185 [Thermoplasmata archaeon]|nr:hypothetical protein [Thermoplasmata archaeon]